MTIIVPGSNTKKLASAVARLSGLKIAPKTVIKFPDGESYVRLMDSDLSGHKVFIIQTLYPKQNDCIIELMLTVDAAKRAGGKPVAVLPYAAYARQDKVFEKGEAFSLEVMGRTLKTLGAEMVIFVDAHFHRKVGAFDFFGIPARNISSLDLLLDYGKKLSKGKFTIVGPDKGSESFLSGLDGVVFLDKKKKFEDRDGKRSYRIETIVPTDMNGKTVLILDDMISGGGTMIGAAKALKKKGNRVFAGCVHGLFVSGSLEKLKNETEGIFCTDTIETEVSEVSVAGIIAEEIKRKK